MKTMKISSACFVLLHAWLIAATEGFCCCKYMRNHVTCGQRKVKLGQAAAATSDDAAADRLLHLVEQPQQEKGPVRELIDKLSTFDQTISDASDPFTPLLGNYNVSCTIPSEQDDRPVGGKWNNKGPFKILETWQNLAPRKKPNSVAQAINMILIQALFLKIYVILRGDAFTMDEEDRQTVSEQRQTPGGLSERTVRANFDPPRIVLCSPSGRSLLTMFLGPASSVILDTPYCDDRIRLGKGSKGSRFVFVRSNNPAADEWKRLVNTKPVGKQKLLFVIGLGVMGHVYCSCCKVSGVGRWVNAVIAGVGGLAFSLVAMSSGGIERDQYVPVAEQ